MGENKDDMMSNHDNRVTVSDHFSTDSDFYFNWKVGLAMQAQFAIS